jgi:sphinganine-1-phosphate aldolase
MAQAHEADQPWHDERAFLGGSYFGGEQVVAIANEAYQTYINYNALFARKMFPSVVRYDEEVVDMVLGLLNAPTTAAGTLTSGGTESILLGVKTARDWALSERPNLVEPEMIVPYAAHPAFHKAAHLMGLKVVQVGIDGDYRTDVAALASAINDNTVLLVASAPSYPFGVTDAVNEIAALAVEHDLWLHVDACHGGFVLPLARKLGYQVPDFDFLLEGVRAVSVDIHKLGYANKGVSLLALRDSSLREHQRYEFSDWPAGVYATYGITGSRSSGGVASAWAVMNTLGTTGYMEIMAPILTARDRLIGAINDIDGLCVRGTPDAYLISFGSTDFDIFAVADALEARGWHSNRLTDPPSIHLFLDAANATNIDAYIEDLTTLTTAARAGELEASGKAIVYST